MSGSRSKKYSLVSSSKKNSRSLDPRSVSGYLSTVFLHVSNFRPETLIINFSSSLFLRSLVIGGAGSGLFAIGTQPMAAARANGSHAATDAMVKTVVVHFDPVVQTTNGKIKTATNGV